MQKLVYLEDSYKKTHEARITSIKQKGNHTEIILDETIFYPQGGGQPSDKGVIRSQNGIFEVTHVRMQQGSAIHEGMLKGDIKENELVTLEIDWDLRFKHMRWHSAGHIMHEIIMQLVPGLTPLKGEHGKHAYIEYGGSINPKLADTIEKQTNLLIADDRLMKTELVTYDELVTRVAKVPGKLPKDKPLRILQIEGYPPIPDGGTQVATTSEVGGIKVTQIEQLGEVVRVHYEVNPLEHESFARIAEVDKEQREQTDFSLQMFQSLLLEQQNQLYDLIEKTPVSELEELRVRYFGSHGDATLLIKRLKELPQHERKTAGMLVNEFKEAVNIAFANKQTETATNTETWFDVSLPGVPPPDGHLHIVTQAIEEITDIFARLGFTRVQHPEVDWDWYAFGSLNMPTNHPARDEWETFFIENSKSKKQDSKFSKIVLTPHTSNGQVREMEKGRLPIRMINIAKCYRRQSDVSHVPMFHQFEGLYIDKNVSIGHLKGVFDYFVKHFFGPTRKSRLRPFHFQFTEPSFEIDISCGICNGAGCKLCKEGWLELGGSGMVHPVVLRNGGIDPDEYNGFAFGWGVERTYMMKAGTRLDDIRLLYSNDIRFLEQF